MARIKPRLFQLAGLCYCTIFSTAISVVTITFVNGILGFPILLLRLVHFNRRVLADFCSAVLRVWFSIFMGHLEHFGRLTIVLTGDSMFANESALVVCNHRSWADTVILYSLARQVRMHGDLKFLAKRSLLAFPIYGFAGWVLDVVIFIKRQSQSAGRRMGKMFSALVDPRRGNHPYWVISYLEGTRFTEAKRLSALDFARERHLKTLDYLLQPRTKGFVATVHALRHNAQAVYDVTIGYQLADNGRIVPSFSNLYLMLSLTDRIVHVHQRRIPVAELPQEEEKLKQWIYTLYEQKDELLRGFRQNGRFDGRPMRWNRMTLGYWLRCQAIIYGSFLASAYTAYHLFRYFR